MNRRNLAIAALTLVGLSLILYFALHRETKKPTFAGIQDMPCPGDVVEIENPDDQLGSIAKRGQKLKVTLNWFACNPLERDSLVYYRFSSALDPIVRIVRAIPGDKFEVVRSKDGNAWNLEVNGDLVMSDDGKSPYFFGGKGNTTLGLYQKNTNGVLAENDVIVFAAVPPGDNDSGLFGVTSARAIMGKVEPVQQ